MNFDSFPPTFSDLIFFPILYYISLKGLYLIVLLWHSIFGVLCPMGANGGIDKHRQNEIKMKENWRKWNFEGNFNALKISIKIRKQLEKIILESGNTDFHELPTEIFLFFPSAFPFFLLFFDFLP
jgi:hypothetical protein